MDLQLPLFSSPIMQVYKVIKIFALSKVLVPTLLSLLVYDHLQIYQVPSFLVFAVVNLVIPLLSY